MFFSGATYIVKNLGGFEKAVTTKRAQQQKAMTMKKAQTMCPASFGPQVRVFCFLFRFFLF